MRMLAWVVLAIAIAMMASRASPLPVGLAWDPPSDTPPEYIGGYRVHYGYSSASYQVSTNVGNVTTAVLSSLPLDTGYFFAVTAYSTNGVESDYSNELFIDLYRPRPPTNLRVEWERVVVLPRSPGKGTVMLLR